MTELQGKLVVGQDTTADVLESIRARTGEHPRGGNIMFLTGAGWDKDGKAYGQEEVLRFEPEGKTFVRKELVEPPEVSKKVAEVLLAFCQSGVMVPGEKPGSYELSVENVCLENKRLLQVNTEVFGILLQLDNALKLETKDAETSLKHTREIIHAVLLKMGLQETG